MYASLALACKFSIPSSNFKDHKQPPPQLTHTLENFQFYNPDWVPKKLSKKIKGSLKEITNQINKWSYYYQFQGTSLTNLKGSIKPNLQKLQITSIA